MKKRILALAMAAVLVLTLCACGEEYTPTSDTKKSPTSSPSSATEQEEVASPDFEKTNIVIETSEGVIKAELYPEIAPITVENFQNLISEGFYDGLTFHRVIEGFMIQGGDPKGNGTGGSDKKIKGEFSDNGVENNLKHERGVLSMARSSNMDSASSQFFIMHEEAPHLDGQYAAFGKVTDGMEVVDKIAANTIVEDANGSVLPENQPKIISIKFE
ncbi:MAG: peptidylprolyl isomerase [Ruminococcaceae bacterium]|nr:peptidylprolyl isomerase [Oscillospiraceae bacterium]